MVATAGLGTDAVVDEVDELEDSRVWWMHLGAGIVWLVLGFALLTGRTEITTVKTVGVLFGVGLIVAAFIELTMAYVVEGWKWVRILLGITSFVAGLVALTWPGPTFLGVAAIIGWYLLVAGSLHIAAGFESRGEDLWWTGLVAGVAEILLAFWAIGYPGRSIQLLLVWVAAAALVRGVLQLVTAFDIRSARA